MVKIQKSSLVSFGARSLVLKYHLGHALERSDRRVQTLPGACIGSGRGLLWFAVVRGGLPWFAVVCRGLPPVTRSFCKSILALLNMPSLRIELDAVAPLRRHTSIIWGTLLSPKISFGARSLAQAVPKG